MKDLQLAKYKITMACFNAEMAKGFIECERSFEESVEEAFKQFFEEQLRPSFDSSELGRLKAGCFSKMDSAKENYFASVPERERDEDLIGWYQIRRLQVEQNNRWLGP